MSSRALLLSSAKRHPFVGHLRLHLRGSACADLAARVAHTQDPEAAWQAVCALHAALAQARGETATELSESIWAALLALDRGELGPARGEDLSLLVVAWDEQGALASGCGVRQLWRLDEDLSPGADALVLPPLGGSIPPLASLDSQALVGLCQGDSELQPRRDQLAELCAAPALA